MLRISETDRMNALFLSSESFPSDTYYVYLPKYPRKHNKNKMLRVIVMSDFMC